MRPRCPMERSPAMNVQEKSLLTILGVSLILSAIAIPLALQLVPRNAVYGFRTRATVRGDEIWFAANAYFGKALIVASAIGCLLAIAVYFFPLPGELVVPVYVICFAVPSGLAALATLRYVRQWEEGEA
ncbi:MAG: hypothetical protein GC151_16145 [Betaproteobacteria bacterium]|nr:hypothetical protein [Betaproteobacteria bacterium]